MAKADLKRRLEAGEMVLCGGVGIADREHCRQDQALCDRRRSDDFLIMVRSEATSESIAGDRAQGRTGAGGRA